MLDFVRKTLLGVTAAVALVTTFTPTMSDAAVVNIYDNTYVGSLELSQNLGLIDIDNGAFTFAGVTGASSGGLTFSVMSSSIVPAAAGNMQILIQALGTNAINITTLSFGGVNLVLQPVLGGFAAAFSAQLPATFAFNFTGANRGDAIQLTLASVPPIPVPAAGLLLIGALGGLGLLRRRKSI